VLKELYASFMKHYTVRPYPNGEDPTSAFAHALVGGGTNEEYKDDFRQGPKDELLSSSRCSKHTRNTAYPRTEKSTKPYYAKSNAPARTDASMECGKNSTTGAPLRTARHGAWCIYLIALFRYYVFVTHDGYAGLAPVGTKEDSTDRIAFIAG
jgi:hypothetical protein